MIAVSSELGAKRQVFFASLGMLVNPRVMFSSWQVLAFGLSVTAVAVVGKMLGCGAAALPTGFNLRGAYRIGLGMLPRGEVALIVAFPRRELGGHAARDALVLGAHGGRLCQPARMPSIAITGATGVVGGGTAARLAARGVPTRLVVRDPARAPSLDGAEVRVASGYGAREEMAAALDGIRALFLIPAHRRATPLSDPAGWH